MANGGPVDRTCSALHTSDPDTFAVHSARVNGRSAVTTDPAAIGLV